MAEVTHERRRFPRVPIVREAPAVELPVSATVQLVDISQTGVLLSSSQSLGVGRRARLRTRVGSDPLAVQVEVRRVAPASRTTPGSWRLGAEFVGMDEESQRKIDRFLKTEA